MINPMTLTINITDYLVETMHLNAEEHGALLLIKMACVKNGGSVAKSRLPGIARISKRRWQQMETSLHDFFLDEGENWTDKKMYDAEQASLLKLSTDLTELSTDAVKDEPKMRHNIVTLSNLSDRSNKNKKTGSLLYDSNETTTDRQTQSMMEQTELFCDDSEERYYSEQTQSSASDNQPGGKNGRLNYSRSFQEAWKRYPARKGSNPKTTAYKHWLARIREGADPAMMLKGVTSYRTFCEQTGKTGTEFVMQAKRFFGTSREYETKWLENTTATGSVAVTSIMSHSGYRKHTRPDFGFDKIEMDTEIPFGFHG